MQRIDGRVLVSASDLVGFHDCEHLTFLDRRALDDAALRARKVGADPQGALIQRKGDEHEASYLNQLEAQQKVVRIEREGPIAPRIEATLAAMRASAPVIYQAAFLHEHRLGYADFLRRVEQPSQLGAWSYEPVDTKLARSEKASFVLQLSYYSALLAHAQGVEPHAMHVVLGSGEEIAYRHADYSRYFRRLQSRFDAAVERAGNGASHGATYPYRCARCDICHWREHCQDQRERDDHLMLVAGIRRDQVRKLEKANVRTVRELATLTAAQRPADLREATFAKLKAQAAMQVKGRGASEVQFEPIAWPDNELRGLKRLPEPDEGDMFFDMEGDPLIEDGLEYLFGAVVRELGELKFYKWWGHDRAAEKRAFEAFMDCLAAHLKKHPRAHVYHYAPYEPTALKRLACQHATREDFLDELLRGQRFVDLYRVTCEGFRTSQPSYSLKDIERLYRPPRAGEVQDAGASIVAYEKYLQSGEAKLLDEIAAYNEDDCRSLQQLQTWLVARRPADLPWFNAAAAGDAGDEGAAVDSRSPARIAEDEEIAAIRARLLAGAPDATRDLVSHLLEFHRRADKAEWWEMFDRPTKDYEELIADTEAIAGLELVGRVPRKGSERLERFEYQYPEQDFKLREGNACCRLDNLAGAKIVSIDEGARRIVLHGSTKEPTLPRELSIGAGGPIENKTLRKAVRRYAAALADGADRYRALTALLRKDAPRLRGTRLGEPLVPEDAPLDRIIDAVARLDDSYVFIQGPPGAGKTYTGAHVIVALLKKGKRVAVSSSSHKAINNLLRNVEEVAEAQHYQVRGAKKGNAGDEDSALGGRMIRDVDRADEALRFGDLAAGTAWLFADEAADERFDYLIVDEAGQVSLGHLVAMATCAKNIVLLGDQMQLGQPTQGVHPGRSGDSTLDYLLDNAATVPPDRGIFLPTTWRMHPDVCRFISDAIYDGRLRSEAACARQRLVLGADAHPALRPTGLVVLPVEHGGCSQKSEPEALVIDDIYKSLLRQWWIDRNGRQAALTPDDILVVAPYNVQVNHLRRKLPPGARVGTVDKFQGQEAAVVLVSMTTSSQEELPRNVEFLFSRNRLNVAISRARCLSILAMSPELFDVKCATTEQIALANTLYWATELAHEAVREHRAQQR